MDFSLQIYSDFGQFWVEDGLESDWIPSDKEYEEFKQLDEEGSMVFSNGSSLVFLVYASGIHLLRVKMHETEPQLVLDGWHHVEDARITLTNGQVGIHSPTDPSECLTTLKPGGYVFRYSARKLSEYGDGEYQFDVWPGQLPSKTIHLNTEW
jgi:hypothetical protein